MIQVESDGYVWDAVCYDAFGCLVADLSYGGQSVNFDDSVGWGGQWGAYTELDATMSPHDGSSDGVGLILLTRRFYNPNTGRFLTRDPSGFEGGINPYAYTRNNPISYIDPSGLDGWNWKKIGLGAAKFGLEVGMGVVGAAVFPPNPLLGGALGTAVVDGLWAYMVDHQTPGQAAVTALESGAFAVVGGKIAENVIGRVLALPAVKTFIAEQGGKVADFVAELLCRLKGACFAAGTPVQMLAGSINDAQLSGTRREWPGSSAPASLTLPAGAETTTKPIEAVQVGDRVATRNPETGKTEFKRVVSTKVHTVQTLLRIELADSATGRTLETITATPEHPFNVAGSGFTAAINLALGNAIISRAGPALPADSIARRRRPQHESPRARREGRPDSLTTPQQPRTTPGFANVSMPHIGRYIGPGLCHSAGSSGTAQSTRC